MSSLYLFRIYFLVQGLTCVFGISYSTDSCIPGRTVIVHLFNWKWTDIAKECEQFLGPAQFCGVQVSPPNEHRVIRSPLRPWWERYQPVSYLLHSRGGTRSQFIDMVRRCNDVGVRIYADVVINHMTGAGGTGSGSAGSAYNANECCLSFPGVPYGKEDFNGCQCSECCTQSCDIESYQDVQQVRNCRLLHLLDLKLSSQSVQEKIARYLNDLISIGVGGFRIDACKHMWSTDLEAIFAKLNDLNATYFPTGTTPFIFCEVIDLGGEPITAQEYTALGKVTEFKYSVRIGEVFRNINNQKLRYLVNFGEDWGFLDDGDAVVFTDNHDNQRGHGGAGSSILTFRDSHLYKRAVAFMLAYPYGFVRIMSSYSWKTSWDGPPSKGDDIDDVTVSADGSCSNGWICEHRWRSITNMVAFRNIVKGQPLANWWDNGGNQIAFSRGDRGFLAINGEAYEMNKLLQTGLPTGTYCDVISGNYNNHTCSGRSVVVRSDGTAYIYISHVWMDTVIAIHKRSRYEFKASPATGYPGSLIRLRTVIFMYYRSVPGQDLFIRGGSDSRKKCGSCAIPIKQHQLGASAHYDKQNAWAVGDTVLDWTGKQEGQGMYGNTPAEGTPAVWTSNLEMSPGYQPLNVYGDHFWMVDVDVDCSQTSDGWFELKAFVLNGEGWEPDVHQTSTCSGTAGRSTPYASRNHLARCGYINVFVFKNNGCMINAF